MPLSCPQVTCCTHAHMSCSNVLPWTWVSLLPALPRLLAYSGEDGPWFEPQAHNADRTASVLRKACLLSRGSLQLCVIGYLGTIRPSETHGYPGTDFRGCHFPGEVMPGSERGTTKEKQNHSSHH